MSYENNSYSERKPDPTVERSLKYISQYQAFKFKEELKEVVAPIVEGIQKIATHIEALKIKRSGEGNDNK